MRRIIVLVLVLIVLMATVALADEVSKIGDSVKYRQVGTIKDINNKNIQVYRGNKQTYDQGRINRERRNAEDRYAERIAEYNEVITKLNAIQAELDK